MSFNQVASDLSVDVYQQLKTAIEIGRWPDGKKLTDQQKQISLEAILRYENEHLPPEQRTGYITPKKKASVNTSDTEDAAVEEQKLRWQE